jgi:hypothetical protein
MKKYQFTIQSVNLKETPVLYETSAQSYTQACFACEGELRSLYRATEAQYIGRVYSLKSGKPRKVAEIKYPYF